MGRLRDEFGLYRTLRDAYARPSSMSVSFKNAPFYDR
jgi:hypothetical protein